MVKVNGDNWWPRLNKGSKLNFVKTDFARWRDEDDEDDEPEAAGMDMGGMGGPGGFDIQSLMAQMGQGGQGMPDMGEYDDEEEEDVSSSERGLWFDLDRSKEPEVTMSLCLY